jgi:hypothetical protein
VKKIILTAVILSVGLTEMSIAVTTETAAIDVEVTIRGQEFALNVLPISDTIQMKAKPKDGEGGVYKKEDVTWVNEGTDYTAEFTDFEDYMIPIVFSLGNGLPSGSTIKIEGTTASGSTFNLNNNGTGDTDYVLKGPEKIPFNLKKLIKTSSGSAYNSDVDVLHGVNTSPTLDKTSAESDSLPLELPAPSRLAYGIRFSYGGDTLAEASLIPGEKYTETLTFTFTSPSSTAS